MKNSLAVRRTDLTAQIKMEVVVLAAFICLCHAEVLIRVPGPDDFGQSVQYKNQDVIGNYDFGYDEGHPSGGSFRQEAGDVFGNKIGSYGLRDADGRIRIVNYVADANGFRVDVRTNEPGVGPEDPASVTINKPNGIVSPPVAPVVPVAPVPPPVVPLRQPIPPPPPPPAFVKSAPLSPPPPAVGYAVPPFPLAGPVAKLSGPTVKYPAPALQYPIPIPPYSNIAPAAGYYGKLPYPGPYAAAATPAKAVAASVAVPRYAVPLRYGYSGSPPLPAYQVLQYPL